MSTSVQMSLVGGLAETFRALRKAFLDPYRPELHYMRGAGPAWPEKHEANVPVYAARACRSATARRAAPSG